MASAFAKQMLEAERSKYSNPMPLPPPPPRHLALALKKKIKKKLERTNVIVPEALMTKVPTVTAAIQRLPSESIFDIFSYLDDHVDKISLGLASVRFIHFIPNLEIQLSRAYHHDRTYARLIRRLPLTYLARIVRSRWCENCNKLCALQPLFWDLWFVVEGPEFVRKGLLEKNHVPFCMPIVQQLARDWMADTLHWHIWCPQCCFEKIYLPLLAKLPVPATLD